jgi:hypothetical protein
MLAKGTMNKILRGPNLRKSSNNRKENLFNDAEKSNLLTNGNETLNVPFLKREQYKNRSKQKEPF